jgi:hypothetical protein
VCSVYSEAMSGDYTKVTTTNQTIKTHSEVAHNHGTTVGVEQLVAGGIGAQVHRLTAYR